MTGGHRLSTNSVASKSCTSCGGGVPPLTLSEAAMHHQQTPEWSVLDNEHRIERTYKVLAEAYAVVQKIAELAEAEGHHPDISFGGRTSQSRCKQRRSKACT